MLDFLTNCEINLTSYTNLSSNTGVLHIKINCIYCIYLARRAYNLSRSKQKEFRTIISILFPRF